MMIRPVDMSNRYCPGLALSQTESKPCSPGGLWMIPLTNIKKQQNCLNELSTGSYITVIFGLIGMGG